MNVPPFPAALFCTFQENYLFTCDFKMVGNLWPLIGPLVIWGRWLVQVGHVVFIHLFCQRALWAKWSTASPSYIYKTFHLFLAFSVLKGPITEVPMNKFPWRISLRAKTLSRTCSFDIKSLTLQTTCSPHNFNLSHSLLMFFCFTIRRGGFAIDWNCGKYIVNHYFFTLNIFVRYNK